ncbi:YbhB/YbcL family Raf kinase inhibitor-like protein [Extibacter muris]|uniref:YbhB/YbcL family Raf kinase inhibitor-like protein n=1 Tax=Extibacter muris TaxID=1796622 RepID=UPI0021C8F3C0|nr:YbhB/YbcL family Raf kinase inhibitor-like protein [Extibacter muris]MCU0077937.1 YbhB/YbcL family Raf kinase inhibitor-like protein [Extibacter muris]
MKITSNGIIDGLIQKQYGKFGYQFNESGIPSRSLPFKIEDMPENTASFAFILEDKDAYPVTGFVWVHWLGANLTRNELKENESQTATDFLQGANSWISIQGNQQTIEQASCYGGMTPPDKKHTYELHVFALDKLLDLHTGFYLNELYQQMDGHILSEAVIKGAYEA